MVSPKGVCWGSALVSIVSGATEVLKSNARDSSVLLTTTQSLHAASGRLTQPATLSWLPLEPSPTRSRAAATPASAGSQSAAGHSRLDVSIAAINGQGRTNRQRLVPFDHLVKYEETEDSRNSSDGSSSPNRLLAKPMRSQNHAIFSDHGTPPAVEDALDNYAIQDNESGFLVNTTSTSRAVGENKNWFQSTDCAAPSKVETIHFSAGEESKPRRRSLIADKPQGTHVGRKELHGVVIPGSREPVDSDLQQNEHSKRQNARDAMDSPTCRSSLCLRNLDSRENFIGSAADPRSGARDWGLLSGVILLVFLLVSVVY